MSFAKVDESVESQLGVELVGLWSTVKELFGDNTW